MTEKVVDTGEWTLYFQRTGSVGIISSDFAHDVVLYVNGDFADYSEQVAYAEGIAARLNATRTE